MNHLPISFASQLDFVAPVKHEKLAVLQRLMVLLGGRMHVPMTFLLHNRSIRNLLSRDRNELVHFLNSPLVTIARPTERHGDSFRTHWLESKRTKQPSLLRNGEEFAVELDAIVSSANMSVYSGVRANTVFRDAFQRTASSYLRQEEIDRVVASVLDDAIRSEGAEARREIDGAGSTALTRGRIVKWAKGSPGVKRAIVRKALVAARDAYAANAFTGGGVHVYGTSSIGLGRLHERPLADAQELAEGLLRSRTIRTKPCRLSLSKLAATPWSKIEEIVINSDTAREYFRLRLVLQSHGFSSDDVLELAGLTMDYIAHISKHVGSSADSAEVGVVTAIERSIDEHGEHVLAALVVASFLELALDGLTFDGVSLSSAVPAFVVEAMELFIGHKAAEPAIAVAKKLRRKPISHELRDLIVAPRVRPTTQG